MTGGDSKEESEGLKVCTVLETGLYETLFICRSLFMLYFLDA